MPATPRRERTSFPNAGSLLRFESKGGPLLAVGALCGGAGASTLALLIAAAAARNSLVPVLACDTGGPTAALSVYAGAGSARSLPELAAQLAAGASPSGGLIARGPHGVRLLAAAPKPDGACDERALRRVLCDARQAHGLTVIDCGTCSQPADRLAMRLATHASWILPATASGVRRAEPPLDAFTPGLGDAGILVARAQDGERPPFRALRELSECCGAPLVLMPQVGGLTETGIDHAIDLAQVALQAIGQVLRNEGRDASPRT
jgi:hypothetical protein